MQVFNYAPFHITYLPCFIWKVQSRFVLKNLFDGLEKVLEFGLFSTPILFFVKVVAKALQGENVIQFTDP